MGAPEGSGEPMSDREMRTVRGPEGVVVEEAGAGSRVLFVHGGGRGGPSAFGEQLPLADRWLLDFLYRPGYGPSPPLGPEDWQIDGRVIAAWLEQLGSAHVVAHSYGSVGAMLAATDAAPHVRSLTVIESGATAVARGSRAVDAFEAALSELLPVTPETDPDALARGVFGVIEPGWSIPEPTPPGVAEAGRRMLTMRWPMDADIPLDQLRSAPFPKLVISGEGRPAYSAIGEALATGLDAPHVVIPGGPHATQDAGAPFNEALERFLLEAERD